MSIEAALEVVRSLSIDDQRLVTETLIEELGIDPDESVISEAEKEFIEHRLASYRANPDRVRPFEEVIDEIEAKVANQERKHHEHRISP
ncbi:MAG TPA: addiction module protein [Gemmataceae bacterium]|jgi:hypothetical protein|nr:addiction module protein [Gemmataceae bacterium]